MILRELFLNTNHLTGHIPDAVEAMTPLLRLVFDSNSVSCHIPDAVRSWTSLLQLDASGNSLSGSIPCAVGSWTLLQTVNIRDNRGLSGLIPDAVGSWAKLTAFYASNMKLLGILPDAARSWTSMDEIALYNCTSLPGPFPDAVSSLTKLSSLDLSRNNLYGAIPESITEMRKLEHLTLAYNKLCRSIPEAFGSMSLLTYLSIGYNQLSGAIPNAMALMTMMRNFYADSNYGLSGAIPDSVRSWTAMISLQLSHNKLSGSLPESIFSWKWMGVLDIESNALRGSIPKSMASMIYLSDFIAGCNELSGSVESAAVPLTFQGVSYIVSDNDLTGSIPLQANFKVLMCSGNMFEGTIPSLPEVNFGGLSITFLGMSGQAHQTSRLHGPLPLGLNRAMKLKHLLASTQSLEGIIPHLPMATLSMLVVHSNRLKLFQDAQLKADGSAVILVFNNLMSCHLPLCGDVPANLSLSALGNHMRSPCRSFPRWVSSLEQDSLFWVSETEGFSLLVKIMAATSLLACVLASTLGGKMIISVLPRWHRGPEIGSISSGLLSRIQSEVVVRGFFLILLMVNWDLYKCPRTLAVASGCLREGSFLIHTLAVLLWGCICFHFSAVECLAIHGNGPKAAAQHYSLKRLLVWPIWLSLTVVLSFPSVLTLASNSVPGLLSVYGSRSTLIIHATIGVVQGALGSIVIPRLATAIGKRKRFLTTIANLHVSCIFPALVFIYLDAQCLGRWAALWEPCRQNAGQFHYDLACELTDVSGCHLWHQPFGRRITVLQSSDVCDPHHIVGQTSVSRCVELTLLRLQDVWLGKIIMSGILMPAFRLARRKRYKDVSQAVGKLVILIAYAMIASGHLPLLMFVLLIGFTNEILLVAVSWDEQVLTQIEIVDVSATSLTLAGISSFVIHLASATGDLHALLLVMVFVLSHMARRASWSIKSTTGEGLQTKQEQEGRDDLV